MSAKKTFSPSDIAEYYERTEVHYRRGWDLAHSHAMHYGYWDKKTESFRHSLQRMNEVLAAFGHVKSTEKVLDAGCGVGGSSIFLAKQIGCSVTGITLSLQQVERAQANAAAIEMKNKPLFQQANYTTTPFADDSFDVIWALESAVHDPMKHGFFREAQRILRPKGRIIMGEYIKTKVPMQGKDQKLFHQWLDAWAIPDLSTLPHLKSVANQYGFDMLERRDVTGQIRKSSWRMYYGSFFLGTLSAGYRLYNPKVSFFADNHYKGLRYQYPALRRKLWSYYLLYLVKR